MGADCESFTAVATIECAETVLELGGWFTSAEMAPDPGYQTMISTSGVWKNPAAGAEELENTVDVFGTVEGELRVNITTWGTHGTGGDCDTNNLLMQ